MNFEITVVSLRILLWTNKINMKTHTTSNFVASLGTKMSHSAFFCLFCSWSIQKSTTFQTTPIQNLQVWPIEVLRSFPTWSTSPHSAPASSIHRTLQPILHLLPRAKILSSSSTPNFPSISSTINHVCIKHAPQRTRCHAVLCIGRCTSCVHTILTP